MICSKCGKKCQATTRPRDGKASYLDSTAVSDCCGAETILMEPEYKMDILKEEYRSCENCHHYDFCKSKLTADECCYFRVV